MLKVKDVMSSEFAYVKPSAPIIEAAQKMRDSRTGVILVCDNGKFRGLITEKDIVAGIVARACNPKREHVRALMDSQHPMVAPGEDIDQAAKAMVCHGVRVLPVAHNGTLLGLLTVDDLSQKDTSLAAMVLSKTGERRDEQRS